MAATRPALVIQNNVALRRVFAEQSLATGLFHSVAAFIVVPYTFRPGPNLGLGKQQLGLTAKEVDILKFLYRHAHRMVARLALIHDARGYNTGAAPHAPETRPTGYVRRHSTALMIALFRGWAA